MTTNYAAVGANLVILAVIAIGIGALVGASIGLAKRNPLMLVGIWITILGLGCWIVSGQVLASQSGSTGLINGLVGGSGYQSSLGYWMTANQIAPFIAGVGVLLAFYAAFRDRERASTRPAEATGTPTNSAAGVTPDGRICPFCAETVKAAAVVCRYCGRDLPPLES